jgi:transposase InsO family protein
MSMARVVIMAVVLEGRSRSAVARDYGVSRRWVQTLVARYLAEGESAFEPRSRRPHTSPQRTSQAVEDAIVALRKDLTEAGHDAGAETIAWHLRRQAGSSPSVATIWRILSRRGFVTPQPHKRPRSSWRRFEASLPNEVWQADITHWPLAGGNDAEILNILDDHSRLLPPTSSRMRYSEVEAQMKRVFQSASPQLMLPTTSGTSIRPRSSAAGLMTQMPPGPVT